MITIQDDAGCSIDTSFSNNIVLDSMILNGVSCELECDGDIIIYSANASYYGLDSENLVPDSSFSNLCIGDHYFIIVDEDGCGQKYFFTTENDNNGNCELIFYSGLTPNNDQVNDIWIIDGLPDEGGKVTIVNRWGDEVWSSDSYDNEVNVWKGNNMSIEELPASVYFYIAEIGGEVYKGFIELSK
jgi:gliding motility-associated-like protein